jgi:hypothetical protein
VGNTQTLADPKTRQTLAQQLMQGAQGFGNTASGWGMTALQSWRNFTSPEAIQQAREFYDRQIAQGQKQGGVGGFFQQVLGHTGGTTLTLGLGTIDTIRNWDTLAQAQDAQTFFANQVIAGEREGGVTGFFRQWMGYAGGTYSALPLVAICIIPSCCCG